MTTQKALRIAGNISPALWDQMMGANDWEHVVSGLPFAHGADSAYRLMATLSSRDPIRIQDALHHLSKSRLSRGARLMALVDLKRYPEVLVAANDIYPESPDPLDLFDSANATMAVAMASSMAGDYATALANLHTAKLLGATLGMPRRVQQLALEYERIQIRMSRGNPEAIIAAMAMMPLNSVREGYANGILSDAYLALGEYVLARDTAKILSGRAAIAGAFLGQELETENNREYDQLAQAILDPELPIPTPIDEPHITYALLLHVLRALRTKGDDATVAPLLASIEPVGADQHVILGLLIAVAAADGIPVRYSPFEVRKMIRDGIAGMRNFEHLAGFLRRQAPRAAALAGHMPGMPVVFSRCLRSIPLHVGNAIMWEGRVFGLAGQRGSELLARELSGKKPTKREHSMTLSRYNDTWAEIGLGDRQVVSAAWLYQAMLWLAQDEVQDDWLWKAAVHALSGSMRGVELQETVRKMTCTAALQLDLQN